MQRAVCPFYLGMGTAVFLALSSTIFAQELCSDLGDPAGNFVPRGYCTPVNPGGIGETVSIELNDLQFSVLDDPDGRLDIIVPLENSFTAGVESPITYSTSLMWPSQPVSRDSIRVRELGINFRPDPTSPKFAALTNVMAGDVPPASFSWIADPADVSRVIGWTIRQQLEGVPADIGGSISHYHMTTWDLPVGTPVTFSKSVSGGEVVSVVPEPSAHVLLAISAMGLIWFRRRPKLRQILDESSATVCKADGPIDCFDG